MSEPKKRMSLGAFLACVVALPFVIAMLVSSVKQPDTATAEPVPSQSVPIGHPRCELGLTASECLALGMDDEHVEYCMEQYRKFSESDGKPVINSGKLSYDECRSGDIATVLWHADHCNSNDISPAALAFARQYAVTHPSHIETAMKDVEIAVNSVETGLRKVGMTDTRTFLCRSERKRVGGKQ